MDADHEHRLRPSTVRVLAHCGLRLTHARSSAEQRFWRTRAAPPASGGAEVSASLPGGPGVPQHVLPDPAGPLAPEPACEVSGAYFLQPADTISAPWAIGLAAPTQRTALRLFAEIAGLLGPATDDAEATSLEARLRAASTVAQIVAEPRFRALAVPLQLTVLEALTRLPGDATLARVLHAVLASPAMDHLAPPDQALVFRTLIGPDLGFGSARWAAVHRGWATMRTALEPVLTSQAFQALPPEEQFATVHLHLHRPIMRVVLWQSYETQHTALEFCGPDNGAILTYGEGASGTMDRIESPDRLLAFGEEPLHGHRYNGTVFACTIPDQILLVEAIERTFAVNAEKARPTKSTKPRHAVRAMTLRSFMLTLILSIGRRWPSSGAIERRMRRGEELAGSAARPP